MNIPEVQCSSAPKIATYSVDIFEKKKIVSGTSQKLFSTRLGESNTKFRQSIYLYRQEYQRANSPWSLLKCYTLSTPYMNSGRGIFAQTILTQFMIHHPIHELNEIIWTKCRSKKKSISIYTINLCLILVQFWNRAVGFSCYAGILHSLQIMNV